MMKFFYLFLLVLPTYGHSQYYPEPETEKKTAFNAASFGGHQTIERMNAILQQDPSIISDDITHFNIEVKDLFYEHSKKFQSELKLDAWFKYEYLTDKEAVNEQMNLLQQNHPDIKTAWINSLNNLNLSKKMLEQLSLGKKLNVDNQTIYFTLLKADSNDFTQYIFQFNRKNQLIMTASAYGSLSEGDTLLWQRCYYEYNRKELISKTETDFFGESQYNNYDASALSPQKTIETIYKNGAIAKVVKKSYYEVTGLKHIEEVTDFYRAKTGEIDSLVTVKNVFDTEKAPNDAILVSRTSVIYKNDKPVKETTFLFTSVGRSCNKEEIAYTYDDQNRASGLNYTSWDKEGAIFESREEKIEYYPNELIFTSKQLVAPKEFPLQYQISFTFFKK